MKKQDIQKMSRKDKLILNLATSPLAKDANKSLNAVMKLNHKYPELYVIKKSLANLFLEVGNYQESTQYYFLAFMKQKELADLIKLFVSSLLSGHFQLFFIECKISAFLAKNVCVQNEDTLNLLDHLINIFRVKEYTLDFESRFREKYIIDLEVTTFSSTDYCDRFSQQYAKCIVILTDKNNKKRLLEVFEILMQIFKSRSIIEVIKFLIDKEWLEMLYYLKREYRFFVRYYNDCLKLTSQRMLGILPLAIKLRSKHEILKFCANFEGKKPFDALKIRDI